MKDQLIKYVDLLFAGSSNSDEIKQEILQNTLDRYDDLIAQGKTPQAAYSLSISGIGDVSELLGSTKSAPNTDIPVIPLDPKTEQDAKQKRAVAIALYILCPIPLFLLSEFGLDTLGLCLMLLLVAAATALIIMAGKNKPTETDDSDSYTHPVQQDPKADARQELRSSIKSAIWAIGLCVYFALSFFTQAWHITWIIFLMIGPAQGLMSACMDLKEAVDHEN